MIIQDSQLRLLDALATYRYLIPRQLLRLGVCRSRPYLYSILRDLEQTERPLVRKITYGVHPLAGRLPKVLCLTRHGAELLADIHHTSAETYFYPRRHVSPLRHDYFHRTATVDFQIELNRFAEAGGRLAFFQAYFHHTSERGTHRSPGRPQARTRVPLAGGVLVPDAVFRLELPTGDAWLFALEVKNGSDTSAVLRQGENHIRALEEGVLSTKYGFPSAYRVLWVFDRYWYDGAYRSAENPMYAAMRALAERKEWSEFFPCFAFTTLERLTTSFADQWFYVRPNGVIEQGRGGIFDTR
jgi:hypothetical protein